MLISVFSCVYIPVTKSVPVHLGVVDDDFLCLRVVVITIASCDCCETLSAFNARVHFAFGALPLGGFMTLAPRILAPMHLYSGFLELLLVTARRPVSFGISGDSRFP